MEIQLSLFWLNILSIFRVIYSQNENVPAGASSLTFVFDITGSMYDDLVQVIEGAEKIMDTTLARRVNPLYNYILIPFHDPDIGPVIVTRDPEEFIHELQDLYVHGGGDCPEMSVGAIKEAIDISLPNSFIYVFTDARSKDYVLTDDVLSLIQQKQSQVVFVMTGDCGNQTHEGFQAYEKIASTSSGQVFLLKKDQVNQVLDFVKLTVQAQKVNLMSVDSPKKSVNIYTIPVDNKLQEFTVSVTGKAPDIKLWAPGQEIEFTEIDGLTNLLDLKKVKIQNVKEPQPGKWKLQVSSNSSHTVRVHGLSSANFFNGFSRRPVTDISSTTLRPLAGVESYGLVNTSDIDLPAQLYEMELLDLQGNVLARYPLVKDKLRDNIYSISKFEPPESFFYLKVTGIDDEGNSLQRLTATAISSRRPTNPLVYMPDITRGYYDATAFLTCKVISEIPFTVQWSRKQKALGYEQHHSDSSNVTLEVPYATEKSEGLYMCNATNKAGWKATQTFLDVSEPPPSIIPPQNVSALPGEDAIMSCFVFSTVDHNISWYKVGRNSQLTSNRKFHVLNNGSIIIRNIERKDQGKYVCRAGNEGGFTKQSVYVTVQVPPEVTIEPSKQDFQNGRKASFVCVATGYPTPSYYWLRDGELLIPNDRVKIKGSKLTIRHLGRGDEGDYQCLARNPAGESVAVAQLNYIEKPAITLYNKQIMVAVGDPAIMKCSTTGIPPPLVTWYKGDIELTALSYVKISDDGELTILGTQKQDIGKYRCVASNTAGSQSITTQLTVGSAPRITGPPLNTGADIGTNTTLTCRARGLPRPMIKWNFDGKPVVMTGRFTQLTSGELFIQGILPADEGRYTCIVKNKFGIKEHTAFLSVTGILHPVIAYTVPYIEVITGKNVSFSCVLIQGNPIPTVQWLHKGHMISDGNHYTKDGPGKVSIINIQKQHEGDYTCVATNVAGNSTSVVSVNVQVPPSLNRDETEDKRTNFTVDLGSGVVLPCKVDGDPLPTIVWYKDESPISMTDLHYFIRQDGSLEIFSSYQTDTGEYRCTASNIAGNVEKTVSLFVQVPPTIDGELNEKHTIIEEETITLDCVVNGIPQPNVYWRRNFKRFLPKSDRYTFDEFGLTITRAKTTDRALYECVAENVAGETSKVITVIVQTPPTISNGDPSSITAIQGISVVLNCEPEGDPTPMVVWRKDGVTIDTDSFKFEMIGTGTLMVHDVLVQDAGDYICEAESVAGRVSKEFDLIVHAPPEFPQDLPTKTEVIEGEPVTLVCPAVGTPTPTIVWYKDDRLVSRNEEGITQLADGVLEIDRTKASDAGLYRCEATNVAGSVVREIELDVHVPPKVINGSNVDPNSRNPSVILNSNISLSCPVDGDPPPVVTWYKDGNKIVSGDWSEDGRVLYVTFAMVDDAGRYKCVATNVAGETEVTFDLDVYVPPYIDPTASSQDNITVIENQQLVINCPISGIPLPNITWYKDGHIISPDSHVTITSNGRRLSVTNTGVDNSGDYRCVGENVAGNKEKIFSVKVHVPPSVDRPGVVTLTEIILDKDLRITCPATGIPPPKITWFINNQPIKNDTSRVSLLDDGWTLEIRNVQRTDATRYRCKAENEAGQSEKVFDVNILLPSIVIKDRLNLNPKVILNNSLSLSCPVQGNPPPVITWYKNDHMINFTTSQSYERLSEGRQLHIISAGTSDAAVFRCHAENKAGKDDVEFDVEILLPARINMTGINTKPKVLSGTLLTLSCPAVGIPKPNITWYKDGIMLTELTNQLIIDAVDVRDTGKYKCVVRNEAGQSELGFDVKVQVPPSIDIVGIDTNPKVTQGQPHTLICPARGTPPPDITWYKDGQPIDFESEPELMLKANGRRLYFQEVDVKDDGKYKCVASNEAGKSEQDFDLDILVPPTIDESAVDDVSKVVIGHSTSLQCPATGTPIPTIEWYKDGRLLVYSSRIQTENNGRQLNIINATVEDTGNYTCTATNTAGTSSHDMTVLVLVPPSIDESNVIYNPKVHVNRTVLLDCPVEGVPSPDVTWLIDNLPLVETAGRQLLQNNRQLKIQRAQVEDSATYTCQAVNEAGDLSKNFKLTVQLPSKIDRSNLQTSFSIIQNHTVYLNCPVTGSPKPSITWLKDSIPMLDFPYKDLRVLNQDQRLEISNAQVEDAGKYTCRASNVAGSDKQHFELEVKVPPEMTGPRTTTKSTVIVRDPVNLECFVVGVPMPDVTWLKDNKPLDLSENPHIRIMTGGQVLQFVSSLIDDTARFTCRANNSAGLAEKYFDLTVLVPPKVNGSENIQRQSVLINHQHVLDCPASGIPPPKIAWKFRGEVIPEYGSPSHRILNNGGQLLLMNTQLFDAGFYSCIVSNIAGNTSLDFQVEVQVPPTISEGHRHVASVVDTRVRLLCESDGLPKPIVRWEKNGEPFPTIGLRHTMLDKGSLEFVSVQLEDTGDYRCYASNPAGQATQNVTLSVQVRPRMRNQGPVEISVVMGQSVDLPCDVEAYPPPRIMWQLGASILAEYPDSSPNISPNPNYQIVNNSTLRIMKTDISDSGVYICIARNNAGTAIGQVRLQVSVPPKISVSRTEFVVPQGRDIVLPCSFDGKPEPQVTWMKNGIAISNADYHYRVLRSGRLAIPYTRSEDAGTYTCKVVNIAGKDSADMDLIVQVPPTITRDNNLLTSTVGQILLIPCQTSGIPVPVITWLKDSRQIQADDIKYRVETNGTLVIYSLEADDTGSYTCTARNVVGRDSYDRTLRVQVPPTIIQTPFNKEVVINDRFMLKCAATGIPVPTVIWTRNGEPVPTRPSYHGRSRLIIRNTIGQDAGLYTCIAKNPAGRDTASSTVVIKVPPRVTVPDSDTVVIVAEKVLLSCSVGGDPQPDIYWTKNGRSVQLNNRIQQLSNGSLVIYDSTSSDAGDYKCVATNDAGSSEGVATLSVHEPPKLKIEPKNTTVNEGDIMIMNCIAEGEPHPDVAWQRGWTEIVPGGRISILPNNSLRIVASQLSDSGLYRCRASNSLGIILIEAAVTVVVHGRFSDWSDWGTCSKSCGTGIQMRTRKCNDPSPANGGRRCIGVSQDTRTCVVAECPVNGSWGNWVTWAECSVTCGPGELVKHRECDNPVPSHGGEDCEGDSMAVLTCNVKNCPVDGSWSSWSSYGPCSTTCGEGTHFRQRICDNPPPSEGGRSCQGDERDSKKCTVQICAVDGNWGQWSVWVPCSHSCGGGSSRRTRLCNSPIPQYGGQYCQGRDLQVDYCNPEPCPVNGKWSSWGEFGECSASCDGGFRKRFHTCTDPIPSRNGRPCVGPSENLEPCNNEPCPVHGDWNEWGTWSECSTSCDEGFKERHRVCNIPLFGGLPCVGDREQIVECTLGPCSKMPRKAEGNIVGYINSIDITEGRITALATPTNDGTAINASIYNIPSEVSGHLQHLVSVLNPVYWTLSQEVDGASNGFKLTEGEYSRDTQVQFATGEILKMSQYVTGIDSNGVLQFDVIVRGSVPELPDNADIQLYPYSEDYIQTGPDSIYSYSSRLIQINGHMLPYAWNHTISYNPSHGVMPYLVERLSTKDIKVQINPTGRQLQFSLKSKISPGTRGQCPKGFILNSEGSFCTDEDECSTSSPCSHYCHNSPGSYSCSCNHGYSLDRDGETCKDVDECSTSNGGCGENNECINIDGSFICAVMCKDGYRRSGDGQKCIDKDECRETPEVCGQFCRNIPGGYTCSCSVGFELRDDQSGRCTDINECRVGQSSCSHICRNIIGSYKCDCPPGYRLFRKYLCEDVDECLEGIHECRPEQNCVNTRGSYLCQTSCPNGLKQQLDGSCTDVNECLINRHRCYSNQRCINTEGSYHCQCQQGYRSRGPGQPCLDVNECEEDQGVCQHNCTNTVGSFYCICPLGYKLSRDNTKCVDINECIEQNIQCGKEKMCFNQRGDFSCIEIPCPRNYRRDPLTNYCVLECVDANIPCPPYAKFADVIEFRTFALPSGILAHQDLIRLIAYNHLNVKLPRTNFTILENDAKVDFHLRLDDGTGIVYTLQPLEEKTTYKIKVRARSYDNGRNSLRYQTTFIIHISVSAYPY